MNNDQLPSEELLQAHKMATEVTRILIVPIANWYLQIKTDLVTQLNAVANMTAVITCMCILEELFGEEVLREYMKKHKEEARAFVNATRH